MEGENGVTLFDVASNRSAWPINLTDDICLDIDTDIGKVHVVYYAVIGVLVLVNSLLLLVIALKWSMLRQHTVYRYLISCIVSGIITSLFTVYELIHTHWLVDSYVIDYNTLQRYNEHDASHYSLMHWWAFRKGLVVSLILVMELNVVSLIYGVSDNTHFVGRYANSIILASKTQTPDKAFARMRCIKGRRAKYFILVTLAWTIPLILNTPTAISWNCVAHCICLPAFRRDGLCSNDQPFTCSTLWLPLTGSFVVAVAAIHFASMFLVIALLSRIIIKFYVISAPRKLKFSETKKRKVGKVNAHGRRNSNGGLRKVVSSDPPLHSGTLGVSNDSALGLETRIKTSKPRSYSTLPRIRGRPPLHNNIKLLIALAVALFGSTTPMTVTLLSDVLRRNDRPPSTNALNITAILGYCYIAALPFILLVYMSSLRDAAAKTLMRCPCLITTVVATKTRVTRSFRQTKKSTNQDEAKSMKMEDKKRSSGEFFSSGVTEEHSIVSGTVGANEFDVVASHEIGIFSRGSSFANHDKQTTVDRGSNEKF